MKNIDKSRIEIEKCMKELKLKEKTFNETLQNSIEEHCFLDILKQEYNNKLFKKVVDNKFKRVKNIILSEVRKGKSSVIIFPNIIDDSRFSAEAIKNQIIQRLKKENLQIESTKDSLRVKGW